MRKTTIRHLFYLTLLAFGLYQCATVGTPTGGPSDEDPPKLLRTQCTPDSLNLTNFKGNQIVLAFNEAFQVSNLTNELVISPPLKYPYKHRIKKINKTKHLLIIDLADTLQENTTYTLNFGQAVKDLTEKNTSSGLSLTFSTGPYLDSLSFEGIVKSAKGHEPKSNILVTLYNSNDTSVLKNNKPYYYTYTDKSGNYNFNHIKPGNYIINALTDKNNNLKYDSLNESIAFTDSLLIVDTSYIAKNINPLYLFAEDVQKLRLVKIKEKPSLTRVIFNKPIFQYTLTSTDTTFHYYDNKNDLLIYQHLNTTSDSIQINLHVIDSLNNTIDSTFLLKFDSDAAKNTKAKKLIAGLQSIDNQIDKGKTGLEIKLNYPIYKLSESHIKFLHKGDTIQAQIDPNKKTSFDDKRMLVTLFLQNIPKDTLHLVIEPGAFIGLNEDTSELYQSTFFPIDATKLGSISGNIETSYKNYVFQILYKDKIIYSKSNTTTFLLRNIEPGDYTYQLIVDNNNNGAVDRGSYAKRIQPEHLIKHSNVTKLKPNWEIMDIHLNF